MCARRTRKQHVDLTCFRTVINTATGVRPRMMPTIGSGIRKIPGFWVVTPKDTAPRMIVRNENNTPPQPNPTSVLAQSADTAPPIPPWSTVAPAEKISKITTLIAIIPLLSSFPLLFSTNGNKIELHGSCRSIHL